mgnify:FL=1
MNQDIQQVTGTAYWASITVPNTTFEPIYQIEVVLDDTTADEFEANGFPTINGTAMKRDGSPKTSDHYDGRAVLIKRKVNRRKDGTPNVKPRLYDKNGEPTEDMVGNGSTVSVKYRAWEVDNEFGHYKGLDLVKVKVLNLVEFTGSDSDFDDDEF